MHKRGLCRHTVSVCLSVTFVNCVKTNEHISIFSQSGSHTILVFLCQTAQQYSDGTPPPSNGGIECMWGRQKSRFWAYMPAVDAATGDVLSTWSPVEHGHHLASCDTYIAGRILPVFDQYHQAPRAIKLPSPWFFNARATKRALALYTITIDRVYDSKAWCYAENNRTESNCMH